MIKYFFSFIMILLPIPSYAIDLSGFVPETLQPRAQKFLNGLNLSPKLLPTRKHTCFKSEESSHGLGNVQNCVYLFENKTFQFWLMQQDVQAENFNVKNLIGILVDKDSKPHPTSYYFEFDHDLFFEDKILKKQDFKVPCATCHPSGPRVMRGEGALEEWNKKIQELKIVKTYIPDQTKTGTFTLNDSKSAIPLNLHFCKECHNHETGVRAPLLYLHKGSIDFLTQAHKNLAVAMPPSNEGLNRFQKDCLANWLKAPSENDCIQDKQLSSHSKSSVAVLVRTTFHDFKTEPIPVDMQTVCVEMQCSFNGSINLQNLKSGIELRDKHILQSIKADQFPRIKFQGIALKGQRDIKVAITLRAVSSTQVVPIDCSTSDDFCTLDVSIDLEKWNVPVPIFLGIGLKEVRISGEIWIK